MPCNLRVKDEKTLINFKKPLEFKWLLCYNVGMKRIIDCAMKREKCDLVVKNARIFNVFTGEIETGELAVANGRIVSIGTGYEGKEIYDAKGQVAIPGLIDSHIHVESSMLSPEVFAALSVPRGTTAIVADPHEIVNVCGVAGAEYVKEAFTRLRAGEVNPLEVFLQLPSCVPATPFETSGAVIDGKETEKELSRELFFGLGEMMNFPAVLAGDEDVLRKIEAAHRYGKPVDGHAPGVFGDAFNAYRCAGVLTDHESLSAVECREKVSRGMYVQIRCGSSVNNIADAKNAVDGYNFRRYILCSDDKNAKDLATRGHLDDALRRLVASGLPAKYALAMATINVAECYRIADMGALAPRYFADIVLVDDLTNFKVSAVFKRGVLVAENGKPCFAAEKRYLPETVKSTVRVQAVAADDFKINCHGGKLRAMEVQPYGLYTGEAFVDAPNGEFTVKGTEYSKLAVVERHKATGNIGLGLVKGYGFKGGAIGISVAHDSHNLVILGDDDGAMARVVKLLEEAGGGMALVSEAEEDIFPLDIAGLMSSASVEEVIRRTGEIAEKARGMGVKECYEPFMTLVFLSLAVIPKLKLLDTGLFDLVKYSFVPLEEV